MTMAVKEVERKVTKIGNSLGLTLPHEVLDHIGVKHGDEVQFNLEKDGKVSIKKVNNLKNVGVLGELDQDFIDGLNDLFANYDNTIRNLADR